MTARDPADLSFETSRVKARLLCEDDLDLYLALYTDPEVMRYIGPVMGREAAEAQFRKALALNVKRPGRVRYLTGFGIGETGLMPVGILSVAWSESCPRSVEVGVMLLSCMRRGGYGQALLSRLVGRIRASFGLDVVTARHLAQNVAARELFTSLGFSASTNGGVAVELRVLALDR